MIKKQISISLAALILAAASSCITIKTNGHESTPAASRSTSAALSPDQLIASGKLFTAVWMQKSAEYKALCLQAFQLADLRLTEILTYQKPMRPLAIVTDIDETFLDNSPYAIHQALQGKDFDPASWNEWVNQASADTIPGAFAFFHHAAVQGVTVFYVTNRDQAGRAATLKNLRKFNFPNADDQHLLTMAATSSKQARRDSISEHYTIALLLGDNLMDFSALFDNHPTAAERNSAVLNHKEAFGKKFIVLPNPNYGDWENALYQYKHLSPAQKAAAFKKAGKSY